MKKDDEGKILDVIGDLRDLMVERFDKVENRLSNLEVESVSHSEVLKEHDKTLKELTQKSDFHTEILERHTGMLKELKQEQSFAVVRDERIEDDILHIKKKLKMA